MLNKQVSIVPSILKWSYNSNVGKSFASLYFCRRCSLSAAMRFRFFSRFPLRHPNTFSPFGDQQKYRIILGLMPLSSIETHCSSSRPTSGFARGIAPTSGFARGIAPTDVVVMKGFFFMSYSKFSQCFTNG